MEIDNKLDKIFEFLLSNREHNHKVQEKFYLSVIKPYNSIDEKIISLLYHIVNTQSQPRIDYLASFNKKVHSNIKSLKSFKSFVEFVNENNEILINYESLYFGLSKQSGWGNKTSALFVKTIYHLHNNKYSNELKIWNDVPKLIDENDNFYLPVDAVIIAIFKKLDDSKKWDFQKVNNLLNKKYKRDEIEVWDDLWFWGFITQNGSGENREFEWNENKHWSLKESEKDEKSIEIIKSKAEIFLNLVL